MLHGKYRGFDMTGGLARRGVLALLLGAGLAALPLRAAAGDVLVFAAASLGGALDRVAQGWQAETGHRVTVSYAGSSALARQIQAGAPADIFISASADWMDTLAASGDLRADTRRDVLGNQLVLVAHGRDVPGVDIASGMDLSGLLQGGMLAMAMVDAVPAGVYGKQALTNLGLWAAVEPSVAQAENVRAALVLVAQGEAPLGIVYATDAAAGDNVTVIGTFPDGSHEPITYPAAISATSESPQAQAFLDYLTGPEARAIWLAAGYSVPD
jgi:molybdate transport system substrate-binding protein